LTSRKTWPRAQAAHEDEANRILARYASFCAWTPCLPVPVEHIVEGYYGLTILCEQLDEPPGQTILGALSPQDKAIRLNERHIDLFDRCIGPETFTLAHELGHWVYDAVDPAQGQLFGVSADGVVFCRRVDGGQTTDWDIREVNANKFAACLVLPAELVRKQIKSQFDSWRAFEAAARDWGASQSTLKIRLQTLDLEWCLP